jgi:hypothetical protein
VTNKLITHKQKFLKSQNNEKHTVRAGNLGHAGNLGQAFLMFLLLQKSEFGLNILYLLFL